MSRAGLSAPAAGARTAVSLAARVRHLLELIRFSHTVFALPFAFVSMLLAAWTPTGWRMRWQDGVGILLCMVTARSAAMAFNRLVDRRIDARNPRTMGRHLPAGLVSARTVIWFTVLNSAVFVLSTLCFLPNVWPVALALPVLAWLLGYSYAKRFTAAAHFWLGLALGLAPVAAWIAIRAELAWPPVVLGVAVLFWVAGFDILYACQDAAFDAAEGLRSLPARLGIGASLRMAAVCHAVTVTCLGLLGWLVSPPLGVVYGLGVVGVAGLLLYEHALVREQDLTRVNQAFFHVNAVISLGLLAVCMLDLWVF